MRRQNVGGWIAALAVALFTASAAGAVADPNGAVAIDPAKSIAQFGIQHIFVDRVTGTVPITSGLVTFGAGSPIPLSVSAVLDATKLRTDEPDRDLALRSIDYFDTQRFPTWTFTSTKITPAGSASFAMDGLLTLHGVAQPEHLEVTIRGDAAHPRYHAVAHIDRHAFGMKGARLDPVIGNTADITLDIALQ